MKTFIIYFLFLLPVMALVLPIFYMVKLYRWHARFKAAERDTEQAMEMMKRATNHEEFRMREERVRECLETMTAINKEPL